MAPISACSTPNIHGSGGKHTLISILFCWFSGNSIKLCTTCAANGAFIQAKLYSQTSSDSIELSQLEVLTAHRIYSLILSDHQCFVFSMIKTTILDWIKQFKHTAYLFMTLCACKSYQHKTEKTPLPPRISLPHHGGLGVILTLGSQSCIYLLYPRVCSMTTRCYWTVPVLGSPQHLSFEPSHRRVSLLTQNQQGYSHIVFKKGTVVAFLSSDTHTA